MPLFKCDQCGCIENTACSNAAVRAHLGETLLCSQCDPAIGRWHGLFSRTPAPEPFLEDAEFRALFPRQHHKADPSGDTKSPEIFHNPS